MNEFDSHFPFIIKPGVNVYKFKFWKPAKYNVIFLFNCTKSGLFNIVTVLIFDIDVLQIILISEFNIPIVFKEHKVSSSFSSLYLHLILNSKFSTKGYSPLKLLFLISNKFSLLYLYKEPAFNVKVLLFL